MTQSIFTSADKPTRPWRSYLTSGLAHALLIALMFAIFLPAVQEIKKVRENITLIAPRLPDYRPKPVHIQRPKLVTKLELPVKPIPAVVKHPELKLPEIKPQIMASAPLVKELPVIPEAKPDLRPPTPKPQPHTGVFDNNDLAKGPRVPQELKVGGFGDPHGVPASANSERSSLTMARLGSFDLPEGGGKGGGNGRAQAGVRQTSFGSVGDGIGSAGASAGHGSVRTGGFGDSAGAAATEVQPSRPPKPAVTPVEIVFKPKPVYTAEAQSLRIEGQVSLEVVFLSTGTVRVIRVLRGLGHGLDEAAEAAALQIRFKPATRAGVPVDTNATIYISFETA
ncbi:MAG: TonB family protein [Bryobacteraceae bacterium]